VGAGPLHHDARGFRACGFPAEKLTRGDPFAKQKKVKKKSKKVKKEKRAPQRPK
jgi:hypothetical protein